ncbi:response regulator transcription factor [Paenibacillus cineris]|uniref:response regulator transcription factor n=1 Tax=Paenibacillus cineris TaxID=237530 RepID=UPI001B0C4075|nr:response regulator [Paenibacillus cineris]GIO62813.1 DNA-binding response regulator [Paenibacillus cineris]
MNILIVDDERIIREWFHMTVDKLGEEYRIAGEASNGDEALNFCRCHRIDLVVTDVKMPGMTGLELIKRLKEEQPDVRSVIFSSYNDFQFAAEALKLGAREYMLKAEITLPALSEILQKVKRDIEFDQSRTVELDSLRHVLNQNEQALRAAYFRELLGGNSQAERQFSAQMDFFRIGLEEKNLVLLAVGIVRCTEEKGKITDDVLLKQALINVMNETLRNETGGGCSFEYKNGVYLLMVNASASSMKSQREMLLITASRISENLTTFLGLEAAIGISLSYSRLNFLPRQLEEALEAMERNWFYGDPNIAWFQLPDTGIYSDQAEMHALKPTAESYHRLLEERKPREAFETFEIFLKQAGQGKRLMPKQMRAVIMEMVYAMINRARTFQVPEEMLEGILNEAAQQIAHQETFLELGKQAEAALRELVQSMETSRKRVAEPIEQACEFIRLHYAEEISLARVASHVHLSRNYFSELFKKETGLNFNEFLMQVRMERAMDILQQRQTRISDVAAQVGYANVSYFIKLFRKHAGLSPLEYMESYGVSRPR